MPARESLNRRDFLKHAGRPPRVLEWSCERLYMRYIDARSAGALPELLRSLELELEAADEIHLVEREWLAREDFRQALETVLGIRGAGFGTP
jgi:hypothetical protein